MCETELFLNKFIDNRIFPGISILKGNFKTSEEFAITAGRLTYNRNSSTVTDATIYDTASLTKPLITSLLILILIRRKELTPETEVSSLLPSFNKFSFTIKELLTHTSGLPAWFPFYIYPGKTSEKLSNLTEPDRTPCKRVEYSCTGYMILKLIIEKIACISFEAFANSEIFSPLHLSNSYLGSVPDNRSGETAPTEKGNFFERKMASEINSKLSESFNWREELISGVVNDVNSYHDGGSAGNSGLFSNTGDILTLLQQFVPSHSILLSPSETALSEKPLIHNRSASFVINSDKNHSCGPHLSVSAAGHTGFTGTSIWLDYKSMDYYIILTNRIHPKVKDMNFNNIRRKLHSFLHKIH